MCRLKVADVDVSGEPVQIVLLDQGQPDGSPVGASPVEELAEPGMTGPARPADVAETGGIPESHAG